MDKYNFYRRILQNQRLTYVDIGSRDFEVHFCSSFKKLVDFVGVEPEMEEAKKLRDSEEGKLWRSFYFSDKGLSETGGEKVLYVTPNRGSSSIKVPLKSYVTKYNRPLAYTDSQTQKIDTITIDELLIRANVQGGIVFKLDIEGSELEVLGGIKKYSSGLLAVKTEVSFQKIREKQATPSEVLDVMDNLGFDLTEISSVDDLRYSGDKSTYPMKNNEYPEYPLYSRGDVGTAEFVFIKRPDLVPKDIYRSYIAVCVEMEQFDKAFYVLNKFNESTLAEELKARSKSAYLKQKLKDQLGSMGCSVLAKAKNLASAFGKLSIGLK